MIFDFDLAITLGHSPKKIEWLKSNCSRPMSEKEFVTAMQIIKTFRKGSSYNYSPSKLKKEYKKLKNKFNFFQ